MYPDLGDPYSPITSKLRIIFGLLKGSEYSYLLVVSN